MPVRTFKLFLETSNFRINRWHFFFFFVRLGREVRVESPWSYSSKLEFPTQPPHIWHFPENSGREERGQAMQDILTGCEDGRTAAGSRGERSVELKGAIDLCGCVRVWNRYGQEACEDYSSAESEVKVHIVGLLLQRFLEGSRGLGDICVLAYSCRGGRSTNTHFVVKVLRVNSKTEEKVHKFYQLLTQLYCLHG